MHYWLVKSEPDAFSWDQQVANGVEPWTGVRNHTAKQNLKAMRQGDRAFRWSTARKSPVSSQSARRMARTRSEDAQAGRGGGAFSPWARVARLARVS